MAWTSPMTAVPQSTLVANDWNTYIRDNLAETMPAKAATVGSYFVVDAVNSITERAVAQDTNSSVGTRASSTYGHLSDATNSPSVTVTTGQQALVIWAVRFSATARLVDVAASVQVSGATSISADDNGALIGTISAANDVWRGMMIRYFDSLTAGTNTFTLLYRSASGAAFAAQYRHLMVIPF